MQIFNIGAPEFLLIALIALIVLGPENMVKSARQMGKYINRLVRSPLWNQLMTTSREIRDLPTRIVREAGLEEEMKEIQSKNRQISEEINKEISKTTLGLNETARTVNQPVAYSPGNAEKGGVDRANDDPIPDEMDNKEKKQPVDDRENTIHPDGARAEEDRIVPDPGKKSTPPPAIVEIGDEDEIREGLEDAAADASVVGPEEEEEPQAPQSHRDPREENVPPPAVIEVGEESDSMVESFTEPMGESASAERSDDETSRGQPVEENPLEQKLDDVVEDLVEEEESEGDEREHK
jgi:sec-independent protein translocase protein TatB